MCGRNCKVRQKKEERKERKFSRKFIKDSLNFKTPSTCFKSISKHAYCTAYKRKHVGLQNLRFLSTELHYHVNAYL